MCRRGEKMRPKFFAHETTRGSRCAKEFLFTPCLPLLWQILAHKKCAQTRPNKAAYICKSAIPIQYMLYTRRRRKKKHHLGSRVNPVYLREACEFLCEYFAWLAFNGWAKFLPLKLFVIYLYLTAFIVIYWIIYRLICQICFLLLIGCCDFWIEFADHQFGLIV